MKQVTEPATRKSEHPVAADTPYAPSRSYRRPVQEGGVVWLTGLSGAGKSTLAGAVASILTSHGMRSAVLDGDVLRCGLNRDLGFSAPDREENMRRTGEVAALFANEGLIAIVALISPLAALRAQVREIVGNRFREVYVKASVETCEARDPKGLYGKARRGELLDFTGVSAPYEPPLHADWIVDTETQTVGQCITQLANYVECQFVASWDTRERRVPSRGVHTTDLI
ncbi:adenylyl-sulfate kinase [Paraburkholderia sp.]|uniref:adenylyl-sulfate kinase n=1 Tax=Paraburkholderia sp. TaxID=1926495 RepID=UPI00262677EF|nr:adenylyl-sulfate kinase [Paraburkholderia sp.]